MRSTLLSVLLFTLAFTATAFAEDDANEDSPAARVYRDAWWTETGSGDLSRAIELYETALTLEGTDGVKARALLRIGLVQARVGKTEEAIRTFERLAKAYPNEKGTLAEAKERLAGWTAENLEDSFDEWYRRYQFSPAFQAKVVDLVLKLGTRSSREGAADEEKELLTIGRAAIPALERHLDTSNENLRGWATAVLLQLGEVPPVEALLDTEVWWARDKAWATLLTLPADRAAAIRERAGVETESGRILDAVTRGPDAALAFFTRPASDVFRRRIGSHLLRGILGRPDGAPSVERLVRHLVDVRAAANEKVDFAWSRKILESLVERGEATDDVVLDVLRNGTPATRNVVLHRISSGTWRHPEAWRALSLAILEDPLLLTKDYVAQDAFYKAVGQAEDADLEPAARAFAKASAQGKGMYMRPHQNFPEGDFWPGVARLVPVVLSTVDDEGVQRRAIEAYRGLIHAGGAEAAEAWTRLLARAKDLEPRDARTDAAYGVGAATTNDNLDRALEALPLLDPFAAGALLRGLGSNNPERFLEWTPGRIDALLREVNRVNEGGAKAWTPAAALRQLGQSEAGALRVIDRLIAVPGVLRGRLNVVSNHANSSRVQRHVRDLLTERWSSWSPEEQVAAVQSVGHLVGQPEDDDPFVTWIREQLQPAVPQGQVESMRRARTALLRMLPEVLVEDLRAVFDLEAPAQALEAGLLQRLRRTPETYAAVRAARRHPDAGQRAGFWEHWRSQVHPADLLGSSTTYALVYRDMLVDPDASTRVKAATKLGGLRDPSDAPRLTAALEDEDAQVRNAAALALAKVYDRGAIRALAKLLDDPDLNVREAVMQTLEAIKKAEEAKDYWKKFAEDH